MIAESGEKFQKNEVEISTQRLLVEQGEWTEEVSVYLQHAQELKPTTLTIKNNNRPRLVKEISHVGFPSLSRLYASGNNIESIEVLGKIDMPSIMILSLGSNNIISVKAMRKGTWPTLYTINVMGNHFKDAAGLTQAHLPNILRVWVFSGQDRVVDPCFAAKLSNQQLTVLSMHTDSFCINRSIVPTLQGKWVRGNFQ